MAWRRKRLGIRQHAPLSALLADRQTDSSGVELPEAGAGGSPRDSEGYEPQHVWCGNWPLPLATRRWLQPSSLKPVSPRRRHLPIRGGQLQAARLFELAAGSKCVRGSGPRATGHGPRVRRHCAIVVNGVEKEMTAAAKVNKNTTRRISLARGRPRCAEQCSGDTSTKRKRNKHGKINYRRDESKRIEMTREPWIAHAAPRTGKS